MNTDKLTKEDWIILRLLLDLADCPDRAQIMKNYNDMVRSAIHLLRKHGYATVNAAIKTLHLERHEWRREA